MSAFAIEPLGNVASSQNQTCLADRKQALRRQRKSNIAMANGQPWKTIEIYQHMFHRRARN